MGLWCVLANQASKSKSTRTRSFCRRVQGGSLVWGWHWLFRNRIMWARRQSDSSEVICGLTIHPYHWRVSGICDWPEKKKRFSYILHCTQSISLSSHVLLDHFPISSSVIFILLCFVFVFINYNDFLVGNDGWWLIFFSSRKWKEKYCGERKEEWVPTTTMVLLLLVLLLSSSFPKSARLACLLFSP